MSRPRTCLLGGLLAASTVVGCGSSTTATPAPSTVPAPVRPPTGASSLRVATTLIPPSIQLPVGVSVAREERSLILTLPESVLLFERDSAQPVDPGAAQALATRVAEIVLARARTGRVEVVGYASADGPTAGYDLALSDERARTVCQLLRTAGVSVAGDDCRGEGRAHDVAPPGPGAEDRRVLVRLNED